MILINRKHLLVFGLCLVMVSAAGCTGWGTDGPADQDNTESNQSNNSDDLNQIHNETNQTNQSDTNTTPTGSDGGGESDGDSSSGDSAGSELSSDGASEEDSADGSSDSQGSSSQDAPASGDDNDGSTDSSGSSDSSESDDSSDSSGSDDQSSGDSGDQSSDGDDSSGDGDGSGDPSGDGDGPTDSAPGDDNNTEPGNETPPGNETEPGNETHTLTVQVYGPDGEPVENAGVGVSIYDSGEFVDDARTDANGQIQFEVPEGQYEVLVGVDDDSLRQTSDNRLIKVTEDTTFEVNLVKPGPSEPQTHTLTVGAGEAVGVPDVPITIERHSDGATTTTTTNSQGTVEFEVLPGDYTVSGEDKNGNTDSEEVTVDGDRTILLPGLIPEEPDEATLTVEVVDQDGNPVPGVDVGAIGFGPYPPTGEDVTKATTNSNGVATLSVFDTLTYELEVYEETSEGTYQGTSSVDIDGDASTTLTVEFESADTPDPNETNETNQSAAAA